MGVPKLMTAEILKQYHKKGLSWVSIHDKNKFCQNVGTFKNKIDAIKPMPIIVFMRFINWFIMLILSKCNQVIDN